MYMRGAGWPTRRASPSRRGARQSGARLHIYIYIYIITYTYTYYIYIYIVLIYAASNVADVPPRGSRPGWRPIWAALGRLELGRSPAAKRRGRRRASRAAARTKKPWFGSV